jgi:hypothetical protein
MNDSEYNQVMLEREQRLEEALQRAEAGRATHDDWTIIRYECGVPKRRLAVLETFSITGENNGLDS